MQNILSNPKVLSSRILTFGTYRGYTVDCIALADPQYLRTLLENPSAITQKKGKRITHPAIYGVPDHLPQDLIDAIHDALEGVK